MKLLIVTPEASKKKREGTVQTKGRRETESERTDSSDYLPIREPSFIPRQTTQGLCAAGIDGRECSATALVFCMCCLHVQRQHLKPEEYWNIPPASIGNC